jgi:hypothetical protein
VADSEYYVVTFVSTSHAIKLEKLMLPQLHVAIIPTPTEISRSCGLSFRLDDVDLKPAIELLEDAGFPFGVYALSRDKSEGKRRVRLITEKKASR